jgi:hypothetical protein
MRPPRLLPQAKTLETRLAPMRFLAIETASMPARTPSETAQPAPPRAYDDPTRAYPAARRASRVAALGALVPTTGVNE